MTDRHHRQTASVRTHALTLAAVLALLVLVGLAASPASANPRYASIVIDANTGEVLHERHADKPLYPASLTKMMTLYMAFRAIEEGRLRLDQQISLSAHAAGQPPSKLGLGTGGRIRVEDAIYALVTKSANDVAAGLGEAMGGSESAFARMMTEQARALGMNRTTFRNASGLPNSQQRSTARDMATLSQALIHHFPQYYGYFDTQRWTYRGTAYRNHNRLLGRYEGLDGLKTGYIRASGFNLAASARRGNLRVVAVVFGGRTSQSRNDHMVALLDRAFESQRGRYLVANGSGLAEPPLPPRRNGQWQMASAVARAVPDYRPDWLVDAPLPRPLHERRRPNTVIAAAPGPASSDDNRTDAAVAQADTAVEQTTAPTVTQPVQIAAAPVAAMPVAGAPSDGPADTALPALTDAVQAPSGDGDGLPDLDGVALPPAAPLTVAAAAPVEPAPGATEGPSAQRVGPDETAGTVQRLAEAARDAARILLSDGAESAIQSAAQALANANISAADLPEAEARMIAEAVAAGLDPDAVGGDEIDAPAQARSGETAASPVTQVSTVPAPGAAPVPVNETWGIQVGAFMDADAGDDALSRAVAAAPDLLTRAIRIVAAVETDGGMLYRARLMGLQATDASEACTALIRVGRACIPLAPTPAAAM